MILHFEWDSGKAKRNKEKHGVSFEEAILIFDDPFGLRVYDKKHSSAHEERFIQIGESDIGVIIIVVFTIRGSYRDEKYRLISARKGNKRERALYEINKRVPI